MDPGPGLLRQGQVPCQGHRLCGLRDPGQTKSGGHAALVDAAMVPQVPVGWKPLA